MSSHAPQPHAPPLRARPQAAPATRPGPRRRWRAAILAGTLLSAVAIGLAWRAWPARPAPPRAAAPPTTSSPPAAPPDAWLHPPDTGEAAARALTGHAPLRGEPAGLPAPPRTRRTAAFERTHGPWREATVIREADPGQRRRLLAHYEKLATGAGYRPLQLKRPASPAPRVTERHWLSGEADMLVLRVRETRDRTRLVLVRYHRP